MYSAAKSIASLKYGVERNDPDTSIPTTRVDFGGFAVPDGLQAIATIRKLNPAASSWRIGKDISSKTSLPSFLNHSRSAFNALIGPFQKSRPAGVPPWAPPPNS